MANATMRQVEHQEFSRRGCCNMLVWKEGTKWSRPRVAQYFSVAIHERNVIILKCVYK